MSLREHATAGGVLFGSLVLVGPPTYVVVATAVDALLAAAGVTLGPLRLAAVVVPLGLALYTASEVADLQLHGAAALWRGSRRAVLVRHGVLSLVALVGLLEAGWVALSALSWTVGGRFPGAGTGALVGSLAALVAVATVGSLVAFGLGTLEGYRATAD